MARARLIGIAACAALASWGCASTIQRDAAPDQDGAGLSTDAPMERDVGPPRPCSPLRSATVVVVVNVDSVNEGAPERREAVLELIQRLLEGDADGDRVPEQRGLSRVRLLVVPNEIRQTEFLILPCGQENAGEFITSSCGTGGQAQVIDASMDWRAEAGCRLRDVPGDWPACVPEPLEAILVALSPEPGPVDLSPRVGLGEGVNAVWREVDDTLLVVLEASDYRDDCSHRLTPGASELCPGPDLICCEANLPPVSRTATALRAIVRDRPAVYMSLGAHGVFDPALDSPERLDELLSSPECFWGRPHLRMVRLARELHPDMHLVPSVCPETAPGLDGRGLDGVVRDVLARICEP